jgi:antitoxin component HigA of HigAB toxin-antitoxin module
MIRALADNPVVLIEQGAPHRIHDDAALARYTHALFQLTAKDNPTDAEQETIDLLTLLIEDYESKYRLPQADPVDVLKYLMEKGGLRQQDMQAEMQ